MNHSYTSRDAATPHSPPAQAAEKAGGPDRDGVAEAVMDEVIDVALTRRPLRAAKWWHPVVVERLKASGVEPPSRSRFEGRFLEERRRRKALRVEASQAAAALVGAALENAGGELDLGTETVDRRTCELAVSSVTGMPSAGIRDAYRDFNGLAHRLRDQRGIYLTEAGFQALILSDHVADNVPDELMPEWWRRRRSRPDRRVAARGTAKSGGESN